VLIFLMHQWNHCVQLQLDVGLLVLTRAFIALGKHGKVFNMKIIGN
jgi:hypothetical protein